ncbi:tripartite tricarboxylate transporter TctB [Corynebacterium glutamicum]|uniref:tripartite tricarboxylate transporter TctB n=1 Tax=Corynebacterium glutamicum TaxID=1718 RepID=UPI000942EAE5|nr:tripartite tricarboxylate transporter TctB [Corynebacterium glutamicum]MDO5371847.1 tripartite tricarboxylate transporter TctB [Corynebacterium glutamicum]OKX87456.1 Tricarboxylate transport protein TctB [Corynebacterium glutamicum]QDQ19386.1 tripartite tricarboxylate transporter TctB family protein [Corynebacterium glutamicum]QDQ22950.1 tripartite tricarboxylate transporter TctB family protein [Corynebacterium glutamicum]QDX76642.1 Tricarboxylate transport protein TctB [Corynebacterium glu
MNVTEQSGESHIDIPESHQLPGPRPVGEGTFWEGRSGLIMPAILTVFSLYLLIGVLNMDVGNAAFPGPRFFPTILGIAGLLVAVALTIQTIKYPMHPENESGRSWKFHSDYVSLAWAIGGFFAFAVLLPYLGWVLAGALLFWTMTRAFGSKRPGFDVLVSLMMSSVVYLAFDVGLGLNLPSGLLGGGF